MHTYRILRDADPEQGGGDDRRPDPAKPEPKPEPEKGPSLEDIRRQVEERGTEGVARMLRDMQEDNFKYRSELRDMKAKLPPEGAVVLKGDDAKAWQQYRDFGRPADLRKLLDERQQFAERIRERDQRDTLAEAAGLHGWKPSVLTRFARADGVEVAIGDSDAKDTDGKPVRKGFVVTRGDDGQEAERVPLDQYAERAWSDSLDVLREQPAKPTPREDVRKPTPRSEEPDDMAAYARL